MNNKACRIRITRRENKNNKRLLKSYEADGKSSNVNKMTAEELLDLYKAGERDFSNVDLSHEILSHADLAGADFSGANFYGARLLRTNLSGGDFSNANLAQAYLARTNLSGAELSGVSLSGAHLVATNFRGAKYEDVIIKEMGLISSIDTYNVWALTDKYGTEWIRLGDTIMTREAWEDELPDDRSRQSILMHDAFGYACDWFDDKKKHLDKLSKRKQGD